MRDSIFDHSCSESGGGDDFEGVEDVEGARVVTLSGVRTADSMEGRREGRRSDSVIFLIL